MATDPKVTAADIVKIVDDFMVGKDMGTAPVEEEMV